MKDDSSSRAGVCEEVSKFESRATQTRSEPAMTPFITPTSRICALHHPQVFQRANQEEMTESQLADTETGHEADSIGDRYTDTCRLREAARKFLAGLLASAESSAFDAARIKSSSENGGSSGDTVCSDAQRQKIVFQMLCDEMARIQGESFKLQRDAHSTPVTSETLTPMVGKVCRICLSDEHADALLSPCLCSGSSKFVHQSCLGQWRQASPNLGSKIQCEVCRAYYRFNYRKRRFWTPGSMTLSSAWGICFFALLSYYLFVTYCLSHSWRSVLHMLHPYSLLFMSHGPSTYIPGLFLLGAYSYNQLSRFALITIFTCVQITSWKSSGPSSGLLGDFFWTASFIYGLLGLTMNISSKAEKLAPKLLVLALDMQNRGEVVNFGQR